MIRRSQELRDARVGEVELGRLLAGWVQVQPPRRDTMACRTVMRVKPESAVWWWEMSSKKGTEGERLTGRALYNGCAGSYERGTGIARVGGAKNSQRVKTQRS